MDSDFTKFWLILFNENVKQKDEMIGKAFLFMDNHSGFLGFWLDLPNENVKQKEEKTKKSEKLVRLWTITLFIEKP